MADCSRWALTGERGAIRIHDWAHAERLVDGASQHGDTAMLQDNARPLALKRPLAAVTAMTHAQPHPLATLDEAFEVKRAVEAIFSP